MWFLPDSTLLAPAARAVMGRKMEIYAGLVENLDYHVGRLIDHLKKIDEYDNTIFIVFGDNGAAEDDEDRVVVLVNLLEVVDEPADVVIQVLDEDQRRISIFFPMTARAAGASRVESGRNHIRSASWVPGA